MNWSNWYKDYEHFPSLQARLKIVREQIAAALTACPAGPLQIVSICAGDGRDMVGALESHPRRGDVSALLLDNDAESIARGRAAAETAGLATQLRFVEADATLAKNYADSVPADLVLLSGLLGHLRHEDVPGLIQCLPMLCKKGGTVIWNRHLLIHGGREQVPAIRRYFRDSSFAEIHYETTDVGGFAVGRVQFLGEVSSLDSGRVLFEFVGLDRLLRIPPRLQQELPSHTSIPSRSDSPKKNPDANESSIPARFEAMAALHPSQIAVSASGAQWTYAELNSAANRLAGKITSHGAMGDRVVLLMRQDAPLIVAVLAVLKAGRVVVVLNPTEPAVRLQQILTEAEAGLVVADAANRELAAQIANDNQVVIGFEESGGNSGENPILAVQPGAVAFIIFTSGSSGRPKGVMQTHRNIIHNVFRLTQGMQLQMEDRISLLASPSGGQGLSTLWCALLNGAPLCPFAMTETSVAQLTDWIEEQKLTVLILSASIFRHLMKSLPAEKRFLHVRLVRIGSEPASAEDFAAFKNHFSSDCIFLNTLSSSETGNVTQQRFAQTENVGPGRLPVGWAADGMEIRLLDEDRREVRDGEVGEVVVRSRYLSPGYWRDEALTAERFSNGRGADGVREFYSGDLGRRLPDGTLLFMDRKDERVKIHGFRVELSEIEAALRRQPAVENVLVTVRPAANAELQIVAYVVARDRRNGAETLRRAVQKILPAHMVPAHFIFLEKFPLTPHGKIDRTALPVPPEPKKNLKRRERPQDLAELRLTKIWEAALGISGIGRHDDFFELGGTSLQSVEILLAIEEAFDVALPAAVLAEHSTVEQLARLLDGNILIPAPSPLVTLRNADSGRPLFFIHTGAGDVTTYVPLARRLHGRPIYGLQAVGLQAESWPLSSVSAMARRYLPEILAKDPTGPYFLAATCMGGLVAFELAQMLSQRGKTVALLALMDVHFPLPLTWHEPWPRKIYVALRTPLHENWRILRWKMIRALGLGRSGRWLPAYRRFVSSQNGRAGRFYRPVSYPGELTLFVTSETKFPRSDPRLMMYPLAQSAKVIKLPGKRSGLFQRPTVDELAQKLQVCLEEAERGTANCVHSPMELR